MSIFLIILGVFVMIATQVYIWFTTLTVGRAITVFLNTLNTAYIQPVSIYPP
jgi:hypothetical protein